MWEAAKLLELDKVLGLCSKEAYSELGRKRVLLSEPSSDLAEVQSELATVTEMVDYLSQAALPLQGLQEVSPTLKRLAPEGALIDRQEFLPIRDLLAAGFSLKKQLVNAQEEFPRLSARAQRLGDFADLLAALQRVFDAAGEIRDDASPELRRLRRQREVEINKLHETLEVILRKWMKQNFTQEETVTYRAGRLLIPVKAEHRSHIKGVIQDESNTGATLFVEPLEAISIGNSLRRLEGEEAREIHRILAELGDKIRAQLLDLTVALEILTQFDSLGARARFSRKLGGMAPEISATPFIHLAEARHPLLVLKESLPVVPLSLTLGGGEGSILVITGPNAGGKTVALKTVGLLCLMTACGLHVPAKAGTKLPLLASLHGDIGDPQSLEEDLSTFTSHLRRLKRALEDVRQPKLVLLDEIGASTDPVEGSALARAALLELSRQGALGVVTTHQGTLKVFAHETPNLCNGSMEFDQETLQPTFRFRAGIPGSSYALEISARVGLSLEILTAARQFIGDEKNQLENLLARLNESLRLSETARREAETKRVEMESLRQLYGSKLKELTKAEKERLRQAAQQAKELLENVNRRIEAEVKNLREQQANRQSIKAAQHAVKQEKAKIEAILKETDREQGETEPEATPQESLQVGDWVRLEGLKDPVQVRALKKEGQEVMLEVGGVHLWMETQRLTRVEPPPEKSGKREVQVALKASNSSSFEIDLRGMTGEEAVFTVEKYLTDCAASGWKSVRIIHGKGTGVLRTRVRELLEYFPGVKSFRYGRPEEGEFGVTVVELE